MLSDSEAVWIFLLATVVIATIIYGVSRIRSAMGSERHSAAERPA